MATTKRDYYEVLGVAKTADGKTLKSAYRRLAMEYHPDRNPDNPEAEAKFKELSEAYSVLSDEQKRAAYDRMGHRAFEGGGMGGVAFTADNLVQDVDGAWVSGAGYDNGPHYSVDQYQALGITAARNWWRQIGGKLPE